jgi:excisionase family DNA binding protein
MMNHHVDAEAGLSSPLDEEQAAIVLGVAPQTLTSWRHTGRYGLKFYKVGRRVKYRREDLEAFLQSRAATQTSARG